MDDEIILNHKRVEQRGHVPGDREENIKNRARQLFAVKIFRATIFTEKGNNGIG